MIETAPLFLPLPDGAMIAVPPRLTCMTTYVLLEQKDWFEPDIVFLRHALQPGMKVIDIGANFGVYTLSIAQKIGREGTVWAFEPANGTADYLAQSIEKNNFHHVHLERAAVSAHEGEGLLFHDRREELFQVDMTGTMGNGDHPHEKIALQTLDGFMARQGNPKIDFIKIDAEGHEIEILKGGLEFFFNQHPVVMLEVIGPDNYTNLDLVDAFMAADYQIFQLLPSLNILVPTDKININKTIPLNIYALKPALIADWLARGLIATAPLTPKIPTNYDAALLLWHQARQPNLDANDRAGRMIIAAEMLDSLAQGTKTLPLLLSLARVMIDMGNQSHAHHTLSLAHDWVTQNPNFVLDQPFLPLSDDTATVSREALPQLILTLKDHWANYSGFFRLPETIQTCQQILGMPGDDLALHQQAKHRLSLATALFNGCPPPDLTGDTLALYQQ